MTISAPGLELRLHVTRQKGLGPHEATLKVLHAHNALVAVEAVEAARHKDVLVQQVGQSDDDGRVGGALESQPAVPRHVLDREHRAVGQEVEVECAVGSVGRGVVWLACLGIISIIFIFVQKKRDSESDQG